MRTDQYIGLTADAENWIKKNQLVEIPDYEIEGAWNQISLRRWISRSPGANGKYIIYTEKVQCAPWSSGPMYFCYLEVDYQNGATARLFEWVLNPDISGEYDPMKGQYYV